MNTQAHIFLADLTHVGDSLSSNVFPLGVGLIGACLKENLDAEIQVEIFKYPNDLSRRLNQVNPCVVGFSNYSWNCNISYDFAERIKDKHPEAVIVFGGPNYGLSGEEIKSFWSRYPLIDFYVVKEGELAMLALVRELMELGFRAELLKSTRKALANCHYQWNGEVHIGPESPRIRDLNHIPSPYLMGMMDKFFDGYLAPLIHTTRGCPFACTFCSEGATYYNKVAQRTELEAELRYIAERIEKVPDLFLSDANFGMYREDKVKAEIISKVQSEFGWPKRLIVSTGKNRKERILEVAKVLDGALKITASLQSTDESILKNIKRSNIATDALAEIAEQSSGKTSGTYSELILGLPGDSVESHMNSLRDVIDSHMGAVRMYQLIMLPQTELNTPESRKKYGMETKFRLMPRSHGHYTIYGDDFCSLEWEEICVANNTLSFKDYLVCRQFDLTVELIHNTGLFSLLQRFCLYLGLSWFEFIESFHACRHSHSQDLKSIYEDFFRESQFGLWDDVEELKRAFEAGEHNISEGERSTNEMANAKAAAVFQNYSVLHETVFSEFSKFISRILDEEPLFREFLTELENFNLLRTKDILKDSNTYEESFKFDFGAMLAQQGRLNPKEFLLGEPIKYELYHDSTTTALISEYSQQYGTSDDGLTRIVMRAPLNEFYRIAMPIDR
ncbi:MAG: cobalamin-dependent protein [Proteobacteria bacterium]|nr:cobalamin-dependent protein [Pseudomonadota bacterium]